MHRWEDLRLADDLIAQLRRIPAEFRRGMLGKSAVLLFVGSSVSEKRIAAEALARDLNLDVLRVDLRTVIRKYVGETEQNLHAVFSEAARSGEIVFFDEADALLGKRSNVRDSHDRHLNDYVLQRIEEYEGIVILASDSRENIDDAVTRRMNLVIEFR